MGGLPDKSVGLKGVGLESVSFSLGFRVAGLALVTFSSGFGAAALASSDSSAGLGSSSSFFLGGVAGIWGLQCRVLPFRDFLSI